MAIKSQIGVFSAGRDVVRYILHNSEDCIGSMTI